MGTLSTSDLAAILAANPDLELIGPPVEADGPDVPGLSEHDLQVAVITECARRARGDYRYELIFAIPNGGARHPAVAAKLRAEGVKPGIPDLFLPVPMPSKGFSGAWIELKVGRNQSTVSQLGWQVELARQGYFVAVIHDSVNEVMNVLEWYLSEEDDSCLPSAS